MLRAHLVFVTTYRRPGSTDQVLTSCNGTMHAVCAELGGGVLEFNGEAHHVHLLMSCPPTLAISVLAQRRKDGTAHVVQREHPRACVRARMPGQLWRPSYFAVSDAGAPLSIIKQYIDGQNTPLQTPGSAPRQDGMS